MKFFWRICLIILLIFLIAQPYQLSVAQSLSGSFYVDEIDVTEYPQITLQISAWDENGLPLPNLAPEHIVIQENGNNTIIPSRVEADYEAPLRVALVIDVSGSMAGEPLEDAKVAATRFLDRLSPQDQVAMIAFSEPLDPDPVTLNPQKELGFSADLVPAYDLVESLFAGGGTHLYNAATKAVRLFETQPEGHRAVLLLSDGRNDPSHIGDPDVPIRLAQETGIAFFVIGLGNQIDVSYLQRLANETGGLYLSAPRSSELAVLFGNLASLLKTQYRLSYTSQLPPDGKEHNITLSLDINDHQVSKQVAIGLLPLIPTEAPTALPTTTSLPSPTPIPATATTQPLATLLVPTPTSTPNIIQQLLRNPLSWLMGGLIVVGISWILLKLRKPQSIPESCAKCGFDMTGLSGACPQCGEIRRYPKTTSGGRK